jgi:hypothetical protein
MKIIIDNLTFDYDLACRMLKAKHDTAPFPELEEIWDDIKPITFVEIAKDIKNLEQRRVAINCLGIEQLVKEVSPVLVDTKTLNKKTTWVNPDGSLVEHKFKDTYKLWKVDGNVFMQNAESPGWRTGREFDDVYYVECKDTSTDRTYLIWVDKRSVFNTNNPGRAGWFSNDDNFKITALQAIAWTITTNLREGDIEKIVRQGDCILLKKNDGAVMQKEARHLTEREYKTLLALES